MVIRLLPWSDKSYNPWNSEGGRPRRGLGVSTKAEDFESMSREDLLELRGFIDALLIEQDLERRRTVPAREVIESRKRRGAVLRLELLRYPNGSTSGPHWFRYTYRGDPPKLSARYLGESLPPEQDQ